MEKNSWKQQIASLSKSYPIQFWLVFFILSLGGATLGRLVTVTLFSVPATNDTLASDFCIALGATVISLLFSIAKKS